MEFNIGAFAFGASIFLVLLGLAMIFRPDLLKQVLWLKDKDPFDIGEIPKLDDRPHVLIINHDVSWKHPTRWKDMKLEKALNEQGFRVTQIKATHEEMAKLEETYSCLGHEFTKIILNGGSFSKVYDILEEFRREGAHAH